MKNINFHLVPKFLLLGLFLFPILPLNVSAILLILNLISATFQFYTNLKENSTQKVNIPLPAILLMSLGITYLLFFIISDHPDVAWFHFEKKLAFIGAPLLFYLFRKSNFQIDITYVFKIYLLAANLLSLITLIVFIYSFFQFDLNEDNFAFTVRTLNEKVTKLHPTYLGLILFSATFISVFLLESKKHSHPKTLLVISTLLTMIGAILSGARAPLVAFFLGFIYYILQHKIIPLNLKLTSFLGILILGLIMLKTPILGDRFQGLIQAFQLDLSTLNAVDAIQRYWVYACNYQIIKENWIVGVGTGNVQNHLNFCYQIVDAKIALEQDLNTHNEYANIWIGTGISGLILFLSFLISIWIKFKFWISRTIIIVFATVCLTENLLERQQGVFFFTLFFSLLIFYEKSLRSQYVKSPTSN